MHVWTEEEFKTKFNIEDDLIPSQTMMKIIFEDNKFNFDVYEKIMENCLCTTFSSKIPIEKIGEVKVLLPTQVMETLENIGDEIISFI